MKFDGNKSLTCKSHSLVVVICSVLAAICSAADMTARWTASDHPLSLSDDAITFEYDASYNITALTVTPVAGGTVTLSGDALPFVAGTQIRMATAGRLVISNELSGSGMVVITNVDAAAQIEYNGTLLYTNQWTTMFTGRQLADYAPVKSIRREGSGVYDTGIYYPYNVRRYVDGGISYMSIQLMASQPTTTRALLMRLRQNGDNIEGIVDRACYYTGRFIHGEDIENVIERHAISPEDGFVPSYYVHTPEFDHGYGVNHLVMARTSEYEIVFSGTAVSDLSFAVQAGISVRAAINGLATDVITTPFNMQGGTVVVNSRIGKSNDFGPTVDGNGTLALAETETTDEDTSTDTYDAFIKTSVRVANNRRLSTLTNVTANMSGTYLSGEKYPATFFPYKSYGICLTGELQTVVNATTLRFVIMALNQNGHNINAQCFKAGYLQTNDPQKVLGRYSVYDPCLTPYNFNDTRSVATGTMDGQTGACDFRFMYSAPAGAFFNVGGAYKGRMAPKEAIRSGQNFYEDMKLSIAGTSSQRMLVRMASDSAYPTNGVVEIGAYGELRSDKQGTAGVNAISGDTALIRVLPGGLLRACANYTIGSYQHVHLIGGTLVSRDDLSATASDSICYYNQLTFRDGALATGVPMRVGHAGAVSWRVAGTTPSTCEANILLSSLNNNTYKTVDFNVTDVTDDDGIDFHLRGNVDAFDNTHSNIVLRKTGGGTLAQYGVFASRLAPAPVKIEAGTWLMCGTASPNQAYDLAGGTLATATDTDNSAGRLIVNGDGMIKVADGASLSFADSSTASWLASGKVQIDADLTADTLRFGTSSTALTSQQLKCMRHGDFRVKLDAAGYLRDRIDGTRIILR